MKRARFSETQIVSVLKRQEGGIPVRDIARELGISEATFYNSASETVKNHEIVKQFSILFEKLIESENLIDSYLEMEKHETKFFYKDSKLTSEDAFLITAKRFLKDPEIKKDILKKTKIEVDKQGIQMPPEDSFEDIARLALKNIYKEQKKAFEFDC